MKLLQSTDTNGTINNSVFIIMCAQTRYQTYIHIHTQKYGKIGRQRDYS